MNFLLILLAAFIEFTLASVEGLRSARWAHDWLRWLNRQFRHSPLWHGRVGAAIVILVPVAVLALALKLVFGVSHVLGHLASLLVLLLMLGPADLNREVERWRRVLSLSGADDWVGDMGTAPAGAFIAEAGEVPLGPPTGDAGFDASRHELAALALAADRAWYEPLFWFFVGGPLAAFAYRLCATLGADQAGEAGVSRGLAEARELMEWLPSRLTAFAFGIAGTLAPVTDAARASGILRWGVSAELRARAALAAIDQGRIQDDLVGDPRIYRLNMMHALVRRTVSVWLVMIAVGSFVF